MRNRSRRRWLIIIIGCAVAAIATAIGVTLVLLNPAMTRYVEGSRFRVALEQETARGLHFPNCKFAPIKRTGFVSAKSETFEARDGRKAMTTLDAQGVTARFNPLGVLLRRWQ